MAPRIEQGFREPATGTLLKVMVVRAYEAASGRPCREYVVTDAMGHQQAQVACRSGDHWINARPLRLNSSSPEAPNPPATKVVSSRGRRSSES